MRYFLFVIAAAAALLLSAPATAQMGHMEYPVGKKPPAGQLYGFGSEEQSQKARDDAPEVQFGMQSATVTPLDECLKLLPPEEAAEVRSRYAQPYRECRIRLANKAAEKRHAEVTRKEEAAIPETPRNYVRVQKDPDEDAAPKAPEKADKDAERGFYGIKADDRARYNR